MYCDPKTKRQLSEKEVQSMMVDGIPVFIGRSQLEKDEYASEDPYEVKQSPFHQNRISTTIELIKMLNLPKSISNVLDIGCGTGILTNQFSKEFPSYSFYGCDYSMIAIKWANRSFPHLNLCVSDAYLLPYPKGFFHLVILNNLFEHLDNPLLVIDQISYCLKPGGFIIISTPSRFRFSNLLSLLSGKGTKRMSKYHVTEYTTGQVIEMLSWKGYKVIRVESKQLSPTTLGSKILHFPHKLLRTLLRTIECHHSLESTVFFFAVNLNHQEN